MDNQFSGSNKASQQNKTSSNGSRSSLCDNIFSELQYVSIKQDYKIGKIIGKGSYSEVRKIYCKRTNERRAVKIFRKNELTEDNIRIILMEAMILKKYEHQNILSLHSMYEDSNHIFLVTELLETNLLVYINYFQKCMTESGIKVIFKKIAEAIEYLHDNNLMHRDLKPENILVNIDEDGMISQLKIADFGQACKIRGNTIQLNIYGSPGYLAPESLSCNVYCNHKVDSWSMGIILYNLICGQMPFKGPKIELHVLSKQPVFSQQAWQQCDIAVQDLVLQLLNKDLQNRFEIHQILSHQWLQHIDIQKNQMQYQLLSRQVLN